MPRISIGVHGTRDESDTPRRGWRTGGATAAHSGSASATYSLGMSSQPTVTTMYCRPSTM